MKKILKLILILIFSIVIQGCATHTNFVKKYNAWVGQDISNLIEQIGYPDSTFMLPNKNKVYVYERTHIYATPSLMLRYGYGGYGIFNYSNDVMQETCKLFIETNKKGSIIKWGSRGNHCVSN